MKDAECEELDCHNARFGFALANARDVDGDGYEGTLHMWTLVLSEATWAHTVTLISVSVAVSQTPAYSVRPRIRG